LGFHTAISAILPVKSEQVADFLEVFPASWLRKKKMKKHGQNDRVKVFTDRRVSERKTEIYHGILKMTKRFTFLSFEVCVVLIELLEMILSIAPDLMDRQLADTLRGVLMEYVGLSYFENPPKKSEDENVMKVRLLKRFAICLRNMYSGMDNSNVTVEEGSP
jgi:hypothetical protein